MTVGCAALPLLKQQHWMLGTPRASSFPVFRRFFPEDTCQLNIVASLIRQDHTHIIVLFNFLMVIDELPKNSGVGPGQLNNDEPFIGVCSRFKAQTYFETSLLARRMWQKDSYLDFGNAFKIIRTVSDMDDSNKDKHKHLLTSRLLHLLSLPPVQCVCPQEINKGQRMTKNDKE